MLHWSGAEVLVMLHSVSVSRGFVGTGVLEPCLPVGVPQRLVETMQHLQI